MKGTKQSTFICNIIKSAHRVREINSYCHYYCAYIERKEESENLLFAHTYFLHPLYPSDNDTHVSV